MISEVKRMEKKRTLSNGLFKGIRRRVLKFLVSQIKIVYPVFLELLAHC